MGESKKSLSPTLSKLDANRQPHDDLVCKYCPNSIWFNDAKEVTCYCRVMFLVSWSTKKPKQILECDGFFIGQEQ